MLESILIMLIVLGVLLLIAAYIWEDMVISLVDMIIWFVCALGVLAIEIPYQYVSGGIPSTGTQTISIPALAMLFGMLGLVMGISSFMRILGTLSKK